ANDVGYRFALVVVTPAARRLRVGADARDWHPARQRDTCRYLARWVAVKHRWGLVVDPAERRFLARKLKSCGWPRVLRPGTTPVQVVRNAPGADRTSATLTIPCTVTGSETAAVVLRYAPAGTKRLYRRSASTAAQAGRTVTRVTLRGMRPAAGFDYRCTARTATAGLVLAPKSRRITTLAAPKPAPTTAPAPSPTPGPATTTPAPVPSETTPAGTTTPTPTPTTSTPPPASAPYKLVAVGDLCEGNNANSCDPTGQLASSMKPARVAILGDTQYENGTQTEFNNGYSQSSWNALNSISYPAIGNHEIASGTDAAYCGYFVHAHCPTPAERWYAYDIPSTRWRAIVLDSNYEDPTLGDRANDPAQLAFLKSELDTYKTTRNLLVYWHHPPWENGGAGSAGDQPRLVGFMNRIAAAHVDLVLWGHDHTYTRWARMGSQGPSASGVRAFTVGTGGAVRPRTTKSYPGTQAKSLLAGVLELTLRDADFSWRFVDTTNTVRDSGTMTVTP
ncbi:MAG: metallophosphoesterase, partial [Sporichthyaceae bacterium]